MTRLGLALALWVATAAPASAQQRTLIVIHPGDPQVSTSEPTQYLSVETARTLANGLTYLGLGGGFLQPGTTLAATFQRGLGSGEITMAAGLSPGAASALGAAAGYKQRISPLGPFEAAIAAGARYGFGGSGLGVQAGAPLTMPFGPGELTLQPRAVLPDVIHGLNAATIALMAGYAWPLGDRLRLFGEAAAGYHTSGVLAYEAKLGARYLPLPRLALELGAGVDPLGLGVSVAAPQASSLLSASVRYGF